MADVAKDDCDSVSLKGTNNEPSKKPTAMHNIYPTTECSVVDTDWTVVVADVADDDGGEDTILLGLPISMLLSLFSSVMMMGNVSISNSFCPSSIDDTEDSTATTFPCEVLTQ